MPLSFIEKPLAFVWRDFINELSYKSAFLMQFISVLISPVTFFFISKLFGNFGVSHLKPYGGDYFSFALIGVAIFNYLKVSMEGISKSIQEGQMLGTLGALLVTQTGSNNYPFLFSLQLYLCIRQSHVVPGIRHFHIWHEHWQYEFDRGVAYLVSDDYLF